MNFIVARLLQYLNEEEAFWVLCQIIETMLPPDYYANMVGVLIDQKVFKRRVTKNFQELTQHFEKFGFDPSLLAFQWFVCFFTLNINEHVSLRLWDLFMLKGIRVLFGAGLAYLEHLRQKLMDLQDLASLFMMFDQVQKTEEVNNQRFFSVVGFYYQNFKESTLDRIRTDSRKEVEDEL